MRHRMHHQDLANCHYLLFLYYLFPITCHHFPFPFTQSTPSPLVILSDRPIDRDIDHFYVLVATISWLRQWPIFHPAFLPSHQKLQHIFYARINASAFLSPSASPPSYSVLTCRNFFTLQTEGPNYHGSPNQQVVIGIVEHSNWSPLFVKRLRSGPVATKFLAGTRPQAYNPGSPSKQVPSILSLKFRSRLWQSLSPNHHLLPLAGRASSCHLFCCFLGCHLLALTSHVVPVFFLSRDFPSLKRGLVTGIGSDVIMPSHLPVLES